MKNIDKIAKKLGIRKNDLEQYGKHIAKLPLNVVKKAKKSPGTLVLVTAMTPTPQGEGKTTTAIGLCDGLNRIGTNSIVTLRQPSLGVTFGLKGGATGGGKARVEPVQEINMHFTGDMYAVTEAHSLLSAMLDNHIYQGNRLGINPKDIVWPRAIDMEDRALRKITVGKKVKYETKFIITAASQVMSALTLAKDLKDLRKRVGKIIVAYRKGKKPVTAKDLKADGAMSLLLERAFLPNLVQTGEGNPAIVHGGAFANVSVGTNTLVATKTALGLVGKKGMIITETGFGSDLGLEKFMHIVARQSKLQPKVAVVVATVKAIRRNGLENLWKHVENVQYFGLVPIVAINHYKGDKNYEIKKIMNACKKKNIIAVVSECFSKGGKGAVKLAKEVVKASKKKTKIRFIYSINDPLKVKIEKIAKEIYGAKKVRYLRQSKIWLKRVGEAKGYPICVAKTALSLSDDKNLRGRPEGFVASVKEARMLMGGGFVLVKMGNILLMPGLPLNPAAERMG